MLQRGDWGCLFRFQNQTSEEFHAFKALAVETVGHWKESTSTHSEVLDQLPNVEHGIILPKWTGKVHPPGKGESRVMGRGQVQLKSHWRLDLKGSGGTWASTHNLDPFDQVTFWAPMDLPAPPPPLSHCHRYCPLLLSSEQLTWLPFQKLAASSTHTCTIRLIGRHMCFYFLEPACCLLSFTDFSKHLWQDKLFIA